MFNKVYSKLLTFLKENIGTIIGVTIFYIFINIPVPYYIHSSGGLIDIADKVVIDNEYKQEGNLYLSYVSEIKGNIITYTLSYILPGWDLIKSEEIKSKHETYDDVQYRNTLFLKEANQNAVLTAYNQANKYINIIDKAHNVVYIDVKAKTDLKIKDQIISVNDIQITNLDEYSDIVKSNKLGDILQLNVKTEAGNIEVRQIEVIDYNGHKVTGIYFVTVYQYSTEPKITFKFKESETGPSGGLMVALSIYNKLVEEDITKGYKIVGTGTIDSYGNVGEVSGIEYKLKGAHKDKAQIFLVPNGINYDKAIALNKEHDYNIKIIGVSTFSDAINYLKNL
jgi:Lon-like protease